MGAIVVLGDPFSSGFGQPPEMLRLNAIPGAGVCAGQCFISVGQIKVANLQRLALIETALRVIQRGLRVLEQGVDMRNLPTPAGDAIR